MPELAEPTRELNSFPPVYLLWVEGKAPGAKVHRTLASAEAEAQRLARINIGVRVFIMKSIAKAMCVPSDPIIFEVGEEPDAVPEAARIETDDVPF